MFRTRLRAGIGLVAAGLLAISAAACSGSDPEESEDPGGPAELTVFSPQNVEQDLATNLYTKKLAKEVGINFSFQTTTMDSGPAAEKRQISIASGDYPDLFLLIPWVDQFTQAELMKLGQQGVALPLNDLIDQHAPNIKKALDSNPDYKAMATAPDGKIYGMPQWVDCYHCSYYAKLWMNSDWLDELGLEQPKTTEEMREVLRAFKNDDPNGNGKADEVPLSSESGSNVVPYFMNAFVYDPRGATANTSTLVLNNGKVDIQANKDGWREGLRYVKSLYDEGLIDKGALTQNGEALQQLGANADATILGSATVGHLAVAVELGQEDGRDTGYDAVPPLTGPSGYSSTSYTFPSAPGATFMLTNKASEKDQVAAIKMLDYIFTDQGQMEGQFGEEGVDWAPPAEGDVALNPEVEPMYNTNLESEEESEEDEPRNSSWGALAQYNNTRAFRDAQVVPKDSYDPAGYERRLQEATDLYAGKEDQSQIYPFWAVWPDPASASEVASMQTNIDNYVSQNSMAFITGSKNIDTEWDAYVQGFQGLNLPRYLEILQTAYDKSDQK
jgi:putative aldouronate transport system substrate-binding protein